ncbi:Cyclin-dependent kinase 10 [Physocladia obscura]|uniref:Cyclin-dependent kinase 10 n=1 Tax=Physocladia obscura TaxID=109957 RepID=A0AAD5XIM4_9FUNG|nr:Cyclin-dependent kinase 10 [Physocladia obscura]
MAKRELQELTSVSLARTPMPDPTNFLGSCVSVSVFEKLGRVGEGTYGVVYKARDTRSASTATSRIVALKRIRMENEADGLPVSSLREIALLKSISHENVVRVQEVCVGSSLDQIFMVMEYCEIDLASLMDNVIAKLRPNKFLPTETKSDFGLARKFSEPPRPMTPKVVTLWYRSPEILLGEKSYTVAADMWSVGCILGELIKNSPLLPGKIEKNQFELISNLLGPPNTKIWPGFTSLPLSSLFKFESQHFSQVRSVLSNASAQAVELVLDLLVYDPARRIDVGRALRHPYFRKEGPNPCLPSALRMRLDESSMSRPSGYDGSTKDEFGYRRRNDELYRGNAVASVLKRRLDGGDPDEPERRKSNYTRSSARFRDRETEELVLGARPFQQFDFNNGRNK